MAKTPSPCIDVCKFRRPGSDGERHCIGCSMTKVQKRAFKALKKDAQRRALVDLVMAQQTVMGRYGHWAEAYAKRCRRKGAALPAGLSAGLKSVG
jgi:predicted Fe-S protein YdhL (DUF1289 family)